MKKRRLTWTLIMLSVMVLSFVTMFLPWIKVLGGGNAVLPGTIARRILMVVTGLAFAGSLFFFFAKQTAWGLIYTLVQAVNLAANYLIMRAANPEGRTAVYGMTGWYGVCIFLTAGTVLVWVIGFVLGAFRRPKTKESSRTRDGSLSGLAASPAEAVWETAGPKPSSATRAAYIAKEDWETDEMAEGSGGASLAAALEGDSWEAAKPGSAAQAAAKEDWETDEMAEDFGGTPQRADLPEHPWETEEYELEADTSYFAADEDEADTSACSAAKEDEADTSAYFAADEDEADEESSEDEEEPLDEDFMDALGGFLGSFFTLIKKGAVKGAKIIGAGAAGLKEKYSHKSEDELAADEELAEEDWEEEAGTQAPERGRKRKALTGERSTGSLEGRRRRRGEDKALAEAMDDIDGSDPSELSEEGLDADPNAEDLPYAFEGEADTEEPDSEDVFSGKRTADEIAARIAGEDSENKDRFHIFGRVERDETEEEPEFLRKRRKKAAKKPQKSDVKKGFIPSPALAVKGMILLTAGLVLVIGVFWLMRRFKLETIDLRDYVVISSSGFEGYGKANVTVDREALVKAVADALTRKGEIKPGSGTTVEAFRAYEHYNKIMTQLTVTLDKQDHLFNGDEVTASFAFDNEVLKEYGLKLEPESISYTVRGLGVVRQYSPFDSDLIVDFAGTEPYGQIVLTWAGGYPLHFVKSQEDGLSNGDVVEVTAVPNDGYDAETLATECGIILTETSRQYTVEGLSNYIREVGSLSGAVFTALDAEARTIITEQAANHYGKNETMAGCDYVGSAVLTGTEETTVRNYLYMVYLLTYERGETTFSYYYYVRFMDVILHMDGGYERNESFEVPSGRHGLFGLMDNDDALRIDWLHAVVGFETVEAFYERKVAPLLESYTIDTDLGIDGIPAGALTAAETDAETLSGAEVPAGSGTSEAASAGSDGTLSAETGEISDGTDASSTAETGEISDGTDASSTAETGATVIA